MRIDVRAGLRSLLIPVLALFSALVVAGLIIVFTQEQTLDAWSNFFSEPWQAVTTSWDLVTDAYSALFRGGLDGRERIAETLFFATPLIFSGLSVALGFRAGLFNIGSAGQIIMGSVFAIWVGFTFDLPAVIHLPLVLVGAIVGGGLWGGIVGLLKARTGAHEVITTIMLNFVALYTAIYLLNAKSRFNILPEGRSDPISKPLRESARMPNINSSLGDRLDWMFVLALVAAFLVWWLLFRSTVGFRMRAVGSNPSAARYAGMSVAGTWVLTMWLAGALSGLGGAAQLFGSTQQALTAGGLSAVGFNAIALALLGRNHPAGVVAASLLFGSLQAGATPLQAQTGINVDIILVIQAVIILFVAAPELIKAVYRLKEEPVGAKQSFVTSWGG